MSKTLTKEAKIHLATEVDSYQIIEYQNGIIGLEKYPENNGKDFIHLDPTEEIYLHDYNPNNPDSPYCMKYLRGIYWGVHVLERMGLRDKYTIGQILKDPEEMLTEICQVTSFKGEDIWEK